MMPGMVDYGNDPAVLVFADTDAAMARMRRTAEAAGCRVISECPVAKDARSEVAVSDAAVLVELEGEAADEAVVGLLHWLHHEAERGARRAVVSAPVDWIDLVAASAAHAGIEHLCQASEAERNAAVLGAVMTTVARVRDDGGAAGVRVLQRSLSYAPEPADSTDLEFVRAVLRARRLRDEHFSADLFADPAWDILLDLMAARLERKQVTVSSLCVAAAVPPTTALRWIGVLTERGLLVRAVDDRDRRRAFVDLSDAAARALGSWLRETRQLAEEAL